MESSRAQFGALYLARFASSFGFVTLATLLPEYIDLFSPSGVVIGLFTTAMTLTQTAAVVPVSWAGDRYDKRTVLLVGLALSVATYVTFGFVHSSVAFIAARALQGVALVATGTISLALVGELAPADRRANYIGRYNAARMAAGMGGAIGAGALYSVGGFPLVFAVLAALLVVAFAGVLLFMAPDETTVGGFAFTNLAVNRRILTLTSFRAQYAVAVTLVRTWVPIYAGVNAASGGLAYAALAVGVVVTAEKFTNMLCQPTFGRLSDSYGRAAFVFVGGGAYGLVALAIPTAPAIGTALALPDTVPVLGPLSPAFLPLVALNGLLGVADALREPASMGLFADVGTDDGGIASSFGIRGLVWRPGSVVAPMLGGVLMTQVGMAAVFVAGGLAALAGVATFLGVLSYSHGPRALAEW